MAALFHDLAVLDDHDAVGVADGGQAVSDDEHRPTLHQRVHAVLDMLLSAGVDGGGGFVQNHHRGVLDSGPGDGQQLALALTEVGAVAGDHGLVAVGQAADEAVGVGGLCRGDALLVGGVQTAVADVVHDGAGEQVGVLKDGALTEPQGVLLDVPDVDAVAGDHAALDLIEPVDEVGDGGLARAGGADEGDLLAGVGKDGDLFQHRLALHIGEVHLTEPDGAPQLGEDVVRVLVVDRAPDLVVLPLGHILAHDGVVGGVFPRPDLAVGALRHLDKGAVLVLDHAGEGEGQTVGNLPRPHPGALGAFGLHQPAVPLLGGDKNHLAVVHLGLGVHDLKDALRARHGGQQGGHLHGDLVDGLGDLAAVAQVGDQTADVEPGQRQRAADGGGSRVAHVGDGGGDGHDGGGVEVGAAGALAVLVVELVELALGNVLVGEGLDDLHALDHFLNVAVDGAQRGLLLLIVGAAELADLLEYDNDDDQHDQRAQEQHRGEVQHHDHGTDEGDGGGEELHKALFQRDLHVVRVVGEAAHELAVGVGVKVAQGQLLQAVEQLTPQDVAALLGQLGHEVGLKVGGDGGHNVDGHELGTGGQQPRNGGGAVFQGVLNAVDDGAHHIGARQIGDGGGHHAGQRRDEQQGPPGDIAEHAKGGALQILGLAEAAPGTAARPAAGGLVAAFGLLVFLLRIGHYSCTPSC